MHARLDVFETAPDLANKFYDLSRAVKAGSLPAKLHDLVNIRASTLNGCAFCLDMHVKHAKIHGERELRIHHLNIWRESPLYSPQERAALEWVEALTRLSGEGVPDEVYERVRGHFSESEISELTFSITVINSWNRLYIAFGGVPGSADAAYGLTRAGLN